MSQGSSYLFQTRNNYRWREHLLVELKLKASVRDTNYHSLYLVSLGKGNQSLKRALLNLPRYAGGNCICLHGLRKV